MSANEHRLIYGTDEQPARARRLRAGALEVEFVQGALRHIRWCEIETLRGISFLVRDGDWGTLPAVLRNVRIETAADSFKISYSAHCGPKGAGIAYQAAINGEAGGSLVFKAEAQAEADFVANRIGFVVLHPLEGVVGRPMTVEHTDGTSERIVIPAAIAADQPLFDVRALSHQPTPAVTVAVRMTGDAYEMEDQRNWTDASLKTYIRPLSKPRPFVVQMGERLIQDVALSISGAVSAPSVHRTKTTASIVTGAARGLMPPIGLAVDSRDLPQSAQLFGVLDDFRPSFLNIRADPRDEGLPATLAFARRASSAGPTEIQIEAIVDGAAPEASLGRLIVAVRDAGLPDGAILVCPVRDLKTRPSNTLPKGEKTLADIIAAARARFPGWRIGGGMPTFFTEFNRNPPPPTVDFVAHGTAANIHAADDASIIETLETLPHVMRSVRRLAPGKPYRLGPSSIGMRDNPYGATPAANPDGVRIPMARRDPRHAALFGAAWTLAYAAKAIDEGVEALTLGHIAGDFGVAERSHEMLSLYPLYHILRRLAHAAGTEAIRVDVGSPCAAIGWRTPDGPEMLIANLSGESVETAAPADLRRAVTLDSSSALEARASPTFLDRLRPLPSRTLRLGPFAVARLVR